MDECKHTMTQGRKGERGSWCCASAEHGVKAADNWIGYSTDDVIALVDALRAVYSLAGENRDVKRIVHEAIAKHGGPEVA